MDFSARLNLIRQEFAKHKVDAMLISKLPNIFYLSGFTGTTAQLLIIENKALFLTDFRYKEQFYEEVNQGYELINFYDEPLHKKLLELKDVCRFQRLGVEGDYLSFTQVEQLKEHSDSFLVVPLSGVVEAFREVKEEEEISLVVEAVRIVEEVFKEIVSVLKIGVTEMDIAAEFEYRIRKRDVKKASFSPIVAFGPNSAKPHAGFSNQQVIPGVPITLDLGVSYKGYCSDLTRTIFFGGFSEGWERLYSIVYEAKEIAASYGRAGISCFELDKSARAVIDGEGYGDLFGHGLGHGVGIEVHEAPRVSKTSKHILKEGSVITIEPGIYLAKQGGIRIEDMYLVKKDGLKKLNNLSSELLVIS